MNQHLPPSNIRPIEWQAEDFSACPDGLRTTAPTKPVEQFFILRGKREPFIDGDLVDRATIIADVAEDVETLRQIIAIDLVNGTSRDATDDITSVIIDRWAEDGKLLTEKQKAFVAMCKGEAFANCFKLEEA